MAISSPTSLLFVISTWLKQAQLQTTMASTSSLLEPDDEEPKVLPSGQLYPTPFDLTGDVTKCSRHDVTDCNPLGSELQDLIPYLKSKSLKEKYSSSSSPRRAQSSSSFSPLAPPRIRVPLRCRSTRELSVFCPDCGRGFSRTFNMRVSQGNLNITIITSI